MSMQKLVPLRRFALSNKCSLLILQGSVIDYGWNLHGGDSSSSTSDDDPSSPHVSESKSQQSVVKDDNKPVTAADRKTTTTASKKSGESSDTASVVAAATTISDNTGNKAKTAAIVNAANNYCLGGHGVDGAIVSAGGPTLAADRLGLKILEEHSYVDPLYGDEVTVQIRCRTGQSVITGPGEYGSLHTSYVIHAVGPNYHDFGIQDYPVADRLLASAYHHSLVTAESSNLTHVGFALLSAGIYRGHRKLKQVLRIGLQGILHYFEELKGKERQNQKDEEKTENQVGVPEQPSETKSETSTSTSASTSSSSLEEIAMCCFTSRECEVMLLACASLKLKPIELSLNRTESQEASKNEDEDETMEDKKPPARKKPAVDKPSPNEPKGDDDEEKENETSKRQKRNKATDVADQTTQLTNSQEGAIASTEEDTKPAADMIVSPTKSANSVMQTESISAMSPPKSYGKEPK